MAQQTSVCKNSPLCCKMLCLLITGHFTIKSTSSLLDQLLMGRTAKAVCFRQQLCAQIQLEYVIRTGVTRQ